ncbi:MAG: hypothetical protein WBO37_07240 [Gammaproteobacteria bacterium]
MKFTRTVISSVYLGLTAMLLVACGGGGGGGGAGIALPPATGVSITMTNAEAVGAVVVNSVDIVEGAAGGAGMLTGVSTNTVGSDFNYHDFFVEQLRRLSSLADQANAGSLPGVVIPQTTELCTNGGSLTVSGNVADPITLSVGDTITIQFNSCNEAGIISNGTLAMTISSVTPNFAFFPPYALGIDVTLTSFSVNDGGVVATGNGDISMQMDVTLAGDTNLLLSGNSLTATAGGEVEVLSNYSYDLRSNINSGDYSGDFSGTITSSTIGGAVSFVTLVAFTGNDFLVPSDPTAGELLITNSLDNSKARLIAQPDGINVEILVDADGDDLYETTIMTTWAAL